MSWLWWHAIVTLIVVMLILDYNGIGHAMSNSQSLDKEKWSLSWLIVALCVTLCVRFNAPVSVYGGSLRWRTISRGNEKNCKSSMRNSFVCITSHPIPRGACSHSRAIPQKTCSCCELCRCHWRESWVVNGGWDMPATMVRDRECERWREELLAMKGAVRCGAIVGNASLMSFSRGGIGPWMKKTVRWVYYVIVRRRWCSDDNNYCPACISLRLHNWWSIDTDGERCQEKMTSQKKTLVLDDSREHRK